MQEHNHTGRRQWSSRFGFLMAMIGSAVGLGNLWRFPYVAGRQGGAVFLIVYVVMVAVIGFTVMSAEIAVGRNAASNIVTAFGKHNKRWSFLGVFGVVICFVIVCYYSVIGGWLVKYMGGYAVGGGFVSGGDYAGAFDGFLNAPQQTILFFGLFLAAAVAVILLGVKKGIEKVSKFLMPALFLMLVFVMVVSLCMRGAGEGVKFFLVPDWERVSASGGFGGTVAAAMGQAFFSLSVGFGISATYGSYVKKEDNIPKNTVLICVADTVVAVLAGFAILPAVFASGQQPAAGPGLVFLTLPAVFGNLGGFGIAVGFIFFALVFFAAVTSTISLLEVVVAAVSELFRIRRLWAGLIVGGAAFVVGALIALSQAGLLGGVDLLDLFDIGVNTLLIPVSALLTCVYVGFVWKPKNALLELTNGGAVKFPIAKLWSFAIRFVVPALVLVILVMGVAGLF